MKFLSSQSRDGDRCVTRRPAYSVSALLALLLAATPLFAQDPPPAAQPTLHRLVIENATVFTPEDIAWLPDWHVHENLCFDNNFRIVGLTVDGVCEVGFNYITPPMLHVWTVDTPCGRFAGVDENGLQCHHEH